MTYWIGNKSIRQYLTENELKELEVHLSSTAEYYDASFKSKDSLKIYLFPQVFLWLIITPIS